MTLLYIVPGKPILCLRENLVDRADSVGLRGAFPIVKNVIKKRGGVLTEQLSELELF